MSTCKRSLEIWKIYSKEFTILEEVTNFRSYQFEIEKIYKEVYKNDIKIANPPMIHLRGYEEADREYMKKIKQFSYPQFEHFKFILSK